jgi:hypothetical protein
LAIGSNSQATPSGHYPKGMTDIVVTNDGLRYNTSKMLRQLTNLPISFCIVCLIDEVASLERITGRMWGVGSNMGGGCRVSCRARGSDSCGVYGGLSSRMGGKRQLPRLGCSQVSDLPLTGCFNRIPWQRSAQSAAQSANCS